MAKRKNNSNKKKSGFLFGFLAVFTALMIIVMVFGSVFYVLVHNNVKGIGERLRPTLQGIPVVKLALPPADDPEDPKYLTDSEVREKYNELRKLRDELKRQLEEANTNIQDLTKYKDEKEKNDAENEKTRKLLEEEYTQLGKEKEHLDEIKYEVGKMIASGDKEGFKDYFQEIDSQAAERIYSEIMAEEKEDAEAKKFAQIYESMEADSAAKIFEEMGSSKMDLIVDIFTYMKKESSALILSEMDPGFASKVTDKLSDIYIKQK